ncbi:MAG TPA: polysaccharide deacetylase family protein [Jatrophihabitans sp.]|jgi:peptidoglycan/xylan/chitin deacetylase (PgdA/CDA1 family)|uniref:polysaccharide deacetylase family protein n=1 Tax=Jatrophihabitans sp. TaxID=1932789 RepID=UPI002DFCA3FE|nr:polysaccharide deacetylase family protein [Jatrophihabitans sp.]
MARFGYGLVVGLLALAAGGLAVAPAGSAATPSELITNGSLEAVASGAPVGWTPDSWGGNDAALSVTADAHTGSVAVRATITQYTDGDAKWMPDPVGVDAGAGYTYVDWYTSDRATGLWAAFTRADGSTQYSYVRTVPASATWASVRTDIIAPAGAVTLRVFHVLAGVGSLTVDDIGLTADVACTAPSDGVVTNGGFEDRCQTPSGLPAGWSATTPASATASYADTANAQQGAHAEQIGNGADGQEVGLSTVVTAPAAGQRYQLSLWQSGTTYAYAYVGFTHRDGSTTEQSLMSVPATANAWSRYADEFVTPSDVVALTVTVATSGIGTVTLDSVALTQLANQVPATFRSGTVSLTFDDGAASAYTTAYPVLRSYGYRASFYLNAATLNSPGYLTTAQVRSLVAAGEEIGSHLYHHSNMVQLDDATLRSELTGNAAALHRLVGAAVPINAFASPYGSYTSAEIDTVMQYATSHRTTDGLLNTKANLDPGQIHSMLVTPATTAAYLAAVLQRARTEHDWLVLVYHDVAPAGSVAPGGEAGFAVTPTAFRSQLAAVRAAGLTVAPLSSALASLRSQ